MNTTHTAVSVHGLTKRYGRRTVVDGLDLELPSGVVAGFIGPNGAGKTTTMAMLLGLVRPSAGDGTVLGDALDEPAAFLPRVGAMIESPAFYPALTGRQNLRMFATVGRLPGARIAELLDVLRLDERSDDPYRTYSLGMKQRLGIAAAMLGDPALLILDEPANGLDPQGVREMRELIELEQVCDWLVLIEAGRIVYQGRTVDFVGTAVDGLAVAPEHPSDLAVRCAVLRSAGHQVHERDGRLVVDDVDDGHALAASVNRAAHAAGIVLVELSPLRSSLEDRYLALVRRGEEGAAS